MILNYWIDKALGGRREITIDVVLRAEELAETTQEEQEPIWEEYLRNVSAWNLSKQIELQERYLKQLSGRSFGYQGLGVLGSLGGILAGSLGTYGRWIN